MLPMGSNFCADIDETFNGVDSDVLKTLVILSIFICWESAYRGEMQKVINIMRRGS